MRIHGNVKICRRNNVGEQTDYEKYRDELREDFGFICGYCGKEEAITSKGFEIDHFVPKSIAPERETDYYNLVYACFTCNRKKSKKWPTKNKDLHNDGKVGFVDPATDEFDLHLQRSEDGNIQGITDVGKYMCNQVFKFNIRPIKEMWLCSEILNRQKILEGRIENMSPEESKEYIEINKQLKELLQLLFAKKE
mgnify:CR=1 FL=1